MRCGHSTFDPPILKRAELACRVSMRDPARSSPDRNLEGSLDGRPASIYWWAAENVMITGAHAIIYSRNPDADRAFLRDLLRLPGIDVGGGWLIFALPPSELAVHPTETSGSHELFLMCNDVEAFRAEMQARGVACGPVQEPRWGRLTQVTLPGGGTLGVYEPRHARPPQPSGRKTAGRGNVQTKRPPGSTRAVKKTRPKS